MTLQVMLRFPDYGLSCVKGLPITDKPRTAVVRHCATQIVFYLDDSALQEHDDLAVV
jgi:hypothetical protein